MLANSQREFWALALEGDDAGAGDARDARLRPRRRRGGRHARRARLDLLRGERRGLRRHVAPGRAARHLRPDPEARRLPAGRGHRHPHGAGAARAWARPVEIEFAVEPPRPRPEGRASSASCRCARSPSCARPSRSSSARSAPDAVAVPQRQRPGQRPDRGPPRPRGRRLPALRARAEPRGRRGSRAAQRPARSPSACPTSLVGVGRWGSRGSLARHPRDLGPDLRRAGDRRGGPPGPQGDALAGQPLLPEPDLVQRGLLHRQPGGRRGLRGLGLARRTAGPRRRRPTCATSAWRNPSSCS